MQGCMHGGIDPCCAVKQCLNSVYMQGCMHGGSHCCPLIHDFHCCMAMSQLRFTCRAVCMAGSHSPTAGREQRVCAVPQPDAEAGYQDAHISKPGQEFLQCSVSPQLSAQAQQLKTVMDRFVTIWCNLSFVKALLTQLIGYSRMPQLVWC